MKESLLSPKPEEIQSKLNKSSGALAYSLLSSCMDQWQKLSAHCGWIGTETKIVYWSPRYLVMSLRLSILACLLGLGGPSVGLWPQRLDFFCRKTELGYLAMDEIWGLVYLRAIICFCSNKYCHYTANSPRCVCMKCIF